MAKYAFRFYGASPADWVEGANAGHRVTVCFQNPPDDGELRRLGEAYGAATKSGRAAPHSERWSDRFLELVFGERGRGGYGASHLGPITEFLMAAHAVVPIADAIYHNARDTADAWTQWSLEQGPPVPGPDADPSWGIHRARDPHVGPYAPSPLFGAGVRDAAVGEAIRLAERALAESADEPVRFVRVDESDVPPATLDDAAFSGFDLAEGALRDEHGNDVVGARSDPVALPLGDYPVARDLPRPLAWVRRPDGIEGLAYLDGKGERQVVRVDQVGGQLGFVAVRPDGAEALVGRRDLFRIDLETGEVRAVRLPQGGDVVFEADYFADGKVALAHLDEVTVLDLSGEVARVVAKARTRRPIVVVRGGPLVLGSKRGGYSAFALVNDTLPRVGAIPIAAPFIGHRGGRTLFGWEGFHLEPRITDEALAQAAAKPKRTKKQSKKKPAAPPVTLELVADPPAELLKKLPLGTSKSLLSPKHFPGALVNVEPAGDSLAVGVDGTTIRWFAQDDELEWNEVASAKAPKATYVLGATPEAAIVLAMDPVRRKTPKYPIRLFSFDGEKATERAKLTQAAIRACHHEGRWYLRDGNQQVFVLANLDPSE